MKKFFKVVTVSTMGLLFVLSNDVVAAGLVDVSELGSKKMNVQEFIAHPDGAFEGITELTITAEPDYSGTAAYHSCEVLVGVLKRIKDIPDHLQAISLDLRRGQCLECGADGTQQMFDLFRSIGPRLKSLGLFIRGSLPDGFLVALTNLESLKLTSFPGYFEGDTGIIQRIKAIGPRLKNLELCTVAKVEVPDGFLSSLTNLSSLELNFFDLSSADVDLLITRINNGLRLKAMVDGADRLRLWQHIIDSKCDADLKADAHQRLGNEPGTPDATNPHALAILGLGLPKDNKYVRWARQRLARKYAKSS